MKLFDYAECDTCGAVFNGPAVPAFCDKCPCGGELTEAATEDVPLDDGMSDWINIYDKTDWLEMVAEFPPKCADCKVNLPYDISRYKNIGTNHGPHLCGECFLLCIKTSARQEQRENTWEMKGLMIDAVEKWRAGDCSTSMVEMERWLEASGVDFHREAE